MHVPNQEEAFVVKQLKKILNLFGPPKCEIIFPASDFKSVESYYYAFFSKGAFVVHAIEKYLIRLDILHIRIVISNGNNNNSNNI